MKIQRIPVLALAALLVPAGACGEQKVNTTGRAATAASSSISRYGSADAAEHALVHLRVSASTYRYGSADAAEHALGALRVTSPGNRYGSADAAEHALVQVQGSPAAYRYGSADAAEHAAAGHTAQQVWLRPTDEELAAAYGRIVPEPATPESWRDHASPASIAWVDGIVAMTPEAQRATFGNVFARRLQPARPGRLVPDSRAFLDGIATMTPEQLAATYGYLFPATPTPVQP